MVDAWGIEFDKINNLDFLKHHMEHAATVIGATILSVSGWSFNPYGATVMVVLSESHLSIHTYPEKEFAAIDGYTCGEEIDPKMAMDYLLNIFQPKHVFTKKIIRGSGDLVIVPME